MFGRSFLCVIALVLAAAPSYGQSAIGIDLGATTLGDEFDSGALFEAGLRFGGLKPKRVNADVRLTTFPQALAEGFVLLSADVDAAYVVPLGQSVVATPRAGFSLLGGGGAEGAGGVAGINVGFGIVVRSTSRVGVRLDYGYRNYLSESEGFSTSSFSFGIVWVH